MRCRRHTDWLGNPGASMDERDSAPYGASRALASGSSVLDAGQRRASGRVLSGPDTGRDHLIDQRSRRRGLELTMVEGAPSPPLPSCSALHYNCSALLGGLVDDQITVRLPRPLGRTLRRMSRRLGRRPSEVVRMALEAFLQGSPSTPDQPAARVGRLIGSLSSGVPDLAERHREYVLASLKHAR